MHAVQLCDDGKVICVYTFAVPVESKENGNVVNRIQTEDRSIERRGVGQGGIQRGGVDHTAMDRCV